MSLQLNDPALARYLSPISAASPAGVDARYDETAELVRVEVAKLERGGNHAVDWPQVALGSDKVLTAISKDLSTATYLALAWLQTEGLAALPRGLFLIAALCDRFGAEVHPQRARARANALAWLRERLEIALAERAASGPDPMHLSQALEAVTALEQQAAKLLAKDAPSFTSLGEGLERLRGNAPAGSASQVPVPSSASNGVTPTPASNGAASPPASNGAPAAASLTSSNHTSPFVAPAAAPASAASPAAPAAKSAARLERIEPWLAPIRPDAPAGDDLSHAEDNVALRNEVIGKLEGLGSAQPQWPRVLRDAGQFLALRSKDLVVACYLSAALFETDGLSGLCTGLLLLGELGDRYWDTLYPERPRRRARGLEWLLERLSRGVTSIKLTLNDGPLIEEARTHAKRLSEVLGRLEDDAPALRPLLDALERARLSVPQPAPPPPVTPATAAQAQPAAPAPARPTAPVVSPSPQTGKPAEAPLVTEIPVLDVAQAGAAVRTLSTTLARLAKLRAEANPRDPEAFRLSRAAAWLPVTTAPAVEADGTTTKVPAPDKGDRRTLASMVSRGRWDEVLRNAEDMLAQHRWWLDLNFYAAEALRNLGDEWAPASAAVASATASFVCRFENLTTFCFRDGTPFAEPATRDWIHGLFARVAGAKGNHPNELQTQSQTWVEFETCLRTHGIPKALQHVQPLLEQAAPAERFRMRLSLAEGCVEAKEHITALALFEALDHQVEKLGLDEWDPPLALRVIEGQLRCFAARKRGDADQASRLRARLALLRPESLVGLKD